eukprot:4061391-Alexandrium_andersonii.AAC.1
MRCDKCTWPDTSQSAMICRIADCRITDWRIADCGLLRTLRLPGGSAPRTPENRLRRARQP